MEPRFFSALAPDSREIDGGDDRGPGRKERGRDSRGLDRRREAPREDYRGLAKIIAAPGGFGSGGCRGRVAAGADTCI